MMLNICLVKSCQEVWRKGLLSTPVVVLPIHPAVHQGAGLLELVVLLIDSQAERCQAHSCTPCSSRSARLAWQGASWGEKGRPGGACPKTITGRHAVSPPVHPLGRALPAHAVCPGRPQFSVGHIAR